MYQLRATHVHYASVSRALEDLEAISGPLEFSRYGRTDGPQPTGVDEYIVVKHPASHPYLAGIVIAYVDRCPAPIK